MTVPETGPPCGATACWVLAGPTASGKTAVALEVASREGAEIVSVDSMQVYRGMDVGTAKPTPRQMERVPHHMIDVLEPEESCNVARFRAMALEAIEGIRARGRRPLLVGGSALYLKGLLWGLMEAPGRDGRVRRRLRRECERLGPEALHRRLRRLDPEAAERIHPNDVQRLVRALEVCELTGEPISEGQDQFDGEPALSHRMVGLRWPRDQLYARIERRVDRMMARGLLEEVKRLRGRLGPQSGQAIGYKEVVAHLAGELSLAEALQQTKSNTRRYAKHQLTWLEHFPKMRWVDVSAQTGPQQVVQKCRALFASPA